MPPAPPYPVALPERYRDTPYDELPAGLRARVDAATPTETPAP